MDFSKISADYQGYNQKTTENSDNKSKENKHANLCEIIIGHLKAHDRLCISLNGYLLFQ